MFLKVFLDFRGLNFCSKCIFVLFFKKNFRGIFVRSSRLRAFHEKRLRENWKSQNSYRVYHDCLATIS